LQINKHFVNTAINALFLIYKHDKSNINNENTIVFSLLMFNLSFQNAVLHYFQTSYLGVVGGSYIV